MGQIFLLLHERHPPTSLHPPLSLAFYVQIFILTSLSIVICAVLVVFNFSLSSRVWSCTSIFVAQLNFVAFELKLHCLKWITVFFESFSPKTNSL